MDLAFRRLGEQLNATKKIYDPGVKSLIDIPDERIRHDAAVAILAYKLGRPVERSENLHLHATTDEFKAMLELAKQSPAAMRTLPADLRELAQKAQEHSNNPTKPEGVMADQSVCET